MGVWGITPRILNLGTIRRSASRTGRLPPVGSCEQKARTPDRLARSLSITSSQPGSPGHGDVEQTRHCLELIYLRLVCLTTLSVALTILQRTIND
jgi:hypothetical protein